MNESKFDNSSLINALHQWWQTLDTRKGDRAAIRRCGSVLEVALTQGYQTLYGRLAQQFSDINADRVAAIIGLLSHIRDDDAGKSPAQSFSEGEKPILSPLRFRRLLESQTVEDLYPVLRRALPLVGRKLGIKELARDVYYWGNGTRKSWAYAYRWPDQSKS
jgi:CRISPR system Cascade subunit CasB